VKNILVILSDLLAFFRIRDRALSK